MTIVTGFRAGKMIRRLAGRNHPVVAGGATTHHLDVVNSQYGDPQGSDMAALAYIRTLDVTHILSGRNHTIVTTHAIANDIHMIEIRR